MTEQLQEVKEKFYKKYPDADSRRFEFRMVDGKVVTYFKIGNGGMLGITYDTFL